MNHKCDFCSTCIEYKHISFCCQKCGFTTTCLNNINNHVSNCTGNSVLLKAKNDIVNILLEYNSNIGRNIETYVNPHVNPHVSPHVNPHVSPHVSPHVNPTPPITPIMAPQNVEPVIVPLQLNHKKTVYRIMTKGNIDLVPEKDEDTIAATIDYIDSSRQIDISKFEDLQSNIVYFDTIFGKIKSCRQYPKLLEDLRDKRMVIFGTMSLTGYIGLVTQHVTTLKEIFTTKGYIEKKINLLMGKSLSSLEARLIDYPVHHDQQLDVDEMQTLLLVLKYDINYPKFFDPHTDDSLCKRFTNYGIAVFPVIKLLDIYMFNHYEFMNIIYLPITKSSIEDPFSFYTLDKLEHDKRNWKMDCRLEELCTVLSNTILTYMISIFRKLYKMIFNDNDFRPDYRTRCQLTEGDCEQLVQNIFLVSKTQEFHNIIRKKIVEKATYKPTDKDKFNLNSDDALQRKRLSEKEKDNSDIVKQLFDTITIEEIVDFYRSLKQ